jgi:hypothetical protein
VLHPVEVGGQPGARKIAKVSLSVLAECSFAMEAAAPTGWFMAGSKPADFETAVDAQTVYNSKPSAYMKSKKPSIDGFGTLMQNFMADEYLGKRVRFNAFVKSDGLQDWVGLWMRVDKGAGADTKMLAFDNIMDRPIKGTTGWQNYEVVLDVPPEARVSSLGFLLSGTGTVWLNSADFQIVPTTIPVTGGKGGAASANGLVTVQ